MNLNYNHQFKSIFAILYFVILNGAIGFSQNTKNDWYTHENQDLGFSLNLPEAPNYSDDYESFIIYSYNEPKSKKIYSFFALDLRHTNKDLTPEAQSENFITNIINNLNGELLDKKAITYAKGVKQEVLVQLNTERQLKAQFTLQSDILYYLSVEDINDKINDPTIARFFNSLSIRSAKAKEEKAWISYVSDQGAFSVNLPDEPEDLSREYENPLEPDGEPYFLNMFMIADPPNNDNYLFRYNDQPLGYYMEDVESGFEKIEASLTEKATLTSPPKVIYLNGYEGREYDILLQDKYHSICRVYFRGNRTYLLLMQKIKAGEKANTDNEFFNSFKFEPHSTPELSSFRPAEANFEIQFFEDQRVSIDTLDYDDTYLRNSNDYYTKNTNSGGVYQVSYSDIQDYFRVKDLDSFYDMNKELLTSWNDSIIKTQKVKIDTFDGLEYISENSGSKSYSRHKIWIANKRFFLISGYLAKEELDSAITDSIFNSFKVLENEEAFDIYSSKTELILNDLHTQDSTTFKRAYGALSYYEFEDSDLPKLYKAINTTYKDSTTTSDIQNRLVDNLYTVNDATTLDFLKTLYNQKRTSDPLKGNILQTIPNLSNPDALESYRQLLISDPPLDEDSYAWSIMSPFRDSMAFSTMHYKDLLSLNKHTKYRGNVLSISADMADSLQTNKTMIASNIDALLEYSEIDLVAYLDALKNDEDYDYTYNSLMFNYLYLFNTIENKHPKINTLTQALVENKENKWLRLQAITARINNHLEIDKKLMTQQLDSLFSRLEIIEALHKTNQLKRVPKKYLKPEEFAKLALYNYVGEDDGYPDQLLVLGKFSEENKEYYAISYAYTTEDGTTPEQYLGVVGPIKPITQEQVFERYKSYSGWDTLEDDWKTQARLLIPDLIEYGY